MAQQAMTQHVGFLLGLHLMAPTQSGGLIAGLDGVEHGRQQAALTVLGVGPQRLSKLC